MNLLSLLVETTAKSSAVMIAALIAVACLRRRSAALRHWILSAAIVAALLTPILSVAMPAWRLPIDRIAPARVLTAAPPARATAAPRRADITVRPSDAPGMSLAGAGPIISTAWMAGAGMALLLLIAGLGRLSWIASRARRVTTGRWADGAHHVAREYGLQRPIAMLQSDHPALLVTWGFVAPKVILPRAAQDWDEARVRVVLSHELAHIKRGDWLIQMLAEIVRAGYWFNPVMWIACRRLRLESERATDDVVLRSAGIDGSDYASHLLELARAFARHRPWLPAPAIARPSSLERRVSAMLNTTVNRAPLTRTARLGIVAALSALAIAIASAQGFSTFSGTVFDPLNGYLPGVTMTLTNGQSGAKYEIRSDRTGHYEFVGLPPGSYSLQAILPGFQVLTGTLDLTGRDVQRDVTLKVGELQETISVWPPKPNPDATPSPKPRKPAPDPATMMKACSDATTSAGTMGGNLRQPMKLVDKKPIYPAALAESGVGGVITFAARIGTNGTIVDLQATSSANPDLEQSAATAIRQWEFTPTLLNCIAVEVPMRISVTFDATK